MNWLKKAQQPPKVQILSYQRGGGELNVLIGGMRYTYQYNDPKVIKTLEFYLREGWHGRALGILRKLQVLDKIELEEYLRRMEE